MERQIEKYFQEELNADERLDFLKQVESDNELKKQFIKFKNTYALLSFSDAACGKKTTRDSYTQFLCKMRAKHIRQISFYLFKLASYHHFTHYIRLSGRREPAFRNFTGEYRKQTARTCRTAHQTDTSGWNYCMAELPHNSHLSCHF